MVKNISIPGSTGSIGKQTLDVVRTHPDRFKVIGLSARKNIEVLASQITEFNPELASIEQEEDLKKLKRLLPGGIKTELLSGEEGLKQVATAENARMIVVALVGVSGLLPTIEAIKAGKIIALANKETLVSGGSLVIPLARRHNTSIIPVDSEHSAIFQCIANNHKTGIKKLILTASGGPFRTWSKSDIENARVEEALAHPNWDMGPKVTIDSATLMNKVLEIIEARWLFNINFNNIDVLIHPQSIVHSLVEFVDGSVIAQMSNPTMHLPIQYALSYPERLETGLVKPLDLAESGPLEFFNPDMEKFPCLKFAYDNEKLVGTYPAVLNAANEIAVEAYIDRKIKINDIYRIVKEVLSGHKTIKDPGLKDILDSDREARVQAENLIGQSKIRINN